MAGSEIWKQLTLTFTVNGGKYWWWYFPFQLCSIPMYVCLLLPWIRSKRVRMVLFTFLMDTGLLAGIFTFFDTSGLHYTYWPLTVHSYLWHIMLIVIGLAAGLSREGDGSLKGLGACLLLYAGLCAAAAGINLVFHSFGEINMFFISPYYRTTQAVFRDIAAAAGNTAGIFIYMGAVAAGTCIFHGGWRVVYWIWGRKVMKDK